MPSIRDDLRFICSTIDANLRYAESKSAYFVAFNATALFGVFGALRSLSGSGSGSGIQVMLIASLLFLIFAIISCIYSFVPMLVNPNENSGQSNGRDNALFFMHIKEHSVDTYINLLCGQHQATPEQFLPLDHSVIAQIIVNSRLTARKFAIFRMVATFDLIAVALALGGCIFFSVSQIA